MLRRTHQPVPAREGDRPRSRARERGQVIVLFAGAMIALVALCAVVVDVAWYWTNDLRMQRAADAAALAGVVWLPSKPTTAYSVAKAEAAKNGYTDGVAGVTITPLVDPSNKQRLRVTITGPVGTFFARAVGIDSWPAKRTAKADYVLPVPMGSPQNYYGVGFFEGLVPHTYHLDRASTGDTGLNTPGAAPSGSWTRNSGNMTSAVSGDDSAYAYTATNGDQQQWSSFGLQSGGSAIPNPGGNRC